MDRVRTPREDLPLMPQVVSVFPLTGCILLPGNWLPLHVFEPRYRNLVEDALKGDRLIGMIQPLVPRKDNVAPAEPVPEMPELYRVGGLGRIERCQPEADGRSHILLKGLVRFRTQEEMPAHRGYRRFRVSCAEFDADLDEAAEALDTARLVQALERFCGKRGIPVDCGAFRHLPGAEMVNGLSAALPFPPAEKQALLEARNCLDRQGRLLLLLEMDGDVLACDNGRLSETLH
jgi:uncharacterized protein